MFLKQKKLNLNIGKLRFQTRNFPYTNSLATITDDIITDKRNLHLMLFWCILAPKLKNMTRQSISFTEPNDNWLKAQIENKEYSSKSELVNDLIRQARKQQARIDWISSKLEKAEESGFTSDSKEQILAQSKSLLNG